VRGGPGDKGAREAADGCAVPSNPPFEMHNAETVAPPSAKLALVRRLSPRPRLAHEAALLSRRHIVQVVRNLRRYAGRRVRL